MADIGLPTTRSYPQMSLFKAFGDLTPRPVTPGSKSTPAWRRPRPRRVYLVSVPAVRGTTFMTGPPTSDSPKLPDVVIVTSSAFPMSAT